LFGESVPTVRPAPAVAFLKTRTRPSVCESKGGVSRTLMQGGFWGELSEGSVRETHGRARGSSRNVRHDQPVRHALLKASGALTEWTHPQPPPVLDHSRPLPQGDGSARPALAGGASAPCSVKARFFCYDLSLS